MREIVLSVLVVGLFAEMVAPIRVVVYLANVGGKASNLELLP
jgi:hypothetical protein